MCDARCPLAAGEPRLQDAGRREFLQRSLLAAAAAMVTAACGDGQIGGLAPTAPEAIDQPIGIRVADYPALGAVGGIAIVQTGATPIAVARTAQSSYVALSLVCPHAGYKPIDVNSGTGFRCPNHGATFDYTGQWTGGQRTRDLQTYPTAYNAASGTLTIG